MISPGRVLEDDRPDVAPCYLHGALGLGLLLAGMPAGCRDRPGEVRDAASSAPPAVAPAPAPSATAAPPPPSRCEGVRCASIERCDEATGQCAPDCPAGEVYVPATGPEGFTMGRGKGTFGFGAFRSENHGRGVADTPHKVVLTRPFCMDATEVTVGAYAKCVEEKGCTRPEIRTRWIVFPDKTDHPVNMVHWGQANFYCTREGKSLPTEAQWEWAAGGADGRKWPWGDTPPTCEHADFTAGDLTDPACDCGCAGGGTSPVGTHPKGDREWPAGKIHDLAGNVWEWCLDNYAPYESRAETDPVHGKLEAAPHVVRGGGWNRSAAALTTFFRGTAVVDYQRPALGFRCVRNPG
jgi:formylglycine-generating enzyme required for sulfatase activity